MLALGQWGWDWNSCFPYHLVCGRLLISVSSSGKWVEKHSLQRAAGWLDGVHFLKCLASWQAHERYLGECGLLLWAETKSLGSSTDGLRFTSWLCHSLAVPP